MSIVLFGINGQVGSSIFNALKNDHKIVGFGRDRVDFTKPETALRILKKFQPKYIINASAYTDVNRAELETEQNWMVNTTTVKELANYSQKNHALIIHFSTDYVFDGMNNIPYLESDAPNPINIYGQSKLAAEYEIQNSGCRHLIIRLSWVVSSTHNCFLKTIFQYSLSKKTVSVVNDQVGAPTSNKFIASVIKCIMEHPEFLESGIYHLSCDGQTSWFDYANFIIDTISENRGHKVPTEIIPISSSEYGAVAKRPRNSLLNCRKLFNLIRYKQRKWKADSTEVVKRMLNSG